MKDVVGGVCAPKGFKAGGIRCGIKASAKKRDLALIFSEKSCNAAAMYTTNRVKAASVLVSREHTAGGKIRAIIANSGNANACTGQAGLEAARRMTELVAAETGIDSTEIVVASTGVIGVPLPMQVIEPNIKALTQSLRNDEEGHSAALESIMTTDMRKKEVSIETEIGGKPVRIGGMAKGAGMVHPNMATIFCFLTTDAAITREALDKCLRKATNISFHRMSVDGDTSTNDMIIVLANGEAGNQPITPESAEYGIFAEALEQACIRLARAMARDGEGASKLLTINVSGAADEETAAIFARSVASSNLVKAACFGADANYGRVLCAMGYAGPDFDPDKTCVLFRSRAGEIEMFRNGVPVPFSEKDAKNILSEEEIEIIADLGGGTGKATAWGCDLTYDYVKINGDYRS
jgi:glutamate N-acetyltransferase/amino-acid N-acetyltransferase